MHLAVGNAKLVWQTILSVLGCLAQNIWLEHGHSQQHKILPTPAFFSVEPTASAALYCW